MGSLFWYEARQQWVFDAKDPASGKRRRWYLGPNEVDAQIQYHELVATLLRREVRSQDLTLLDLCARWLTWNEENRSASTARFRRGYMAWLLTWLVGERGAKRAGAFPARALTPAMLEDVKRVHRTASPRSINHFVSTIKGLYRWAMRQGYLTSNPVEYAQGVPNAPAPKRALDWGRVERLCELADTRAPLGDYIRVLAHTGMRSGELAGLPWSAYDAQHGVLTVAKHKTVGLSGRPRLVPVNSTAAAAIGRQPRTGEAIFCREGGVALTRNALRLRFERLRRRHHPELAGISLHALRHTFVSRLLAQGVPIWEVQEIVGHQSQLVTRYYAKASMDRLRQAVDLM